MKWFLLALTIGMIIVHQDFWNWDKADPRAFGFLTVGLWYHALFCVAASILLWMFVAFLWPRHLEDVQREASAEERNAGHRPYWMPRGSEAQTPPADQHGV